MKKALIVALMAAFVALAAANVVSAWTKVGISSYATNPAWLQDWHRVKSNSIVLDDAGNIYATATNGNNTAANPGGLTIYQTDLTQIDINVSALGFPGGVTKLVRAGNGEIYGLQNWMEVHWPYEGLVNRIIHIDVNGTVTEIWNAGPTTPGANEENTIKGLAVGGDGNLYWAMNPASSVWATQFLWRYRVAPKVVDGPSSINDNGQGERHRLFDLEYVGDDCFAIFGGKQATGSDSRWNCDAMKWTMDRIVDQNPADPGSGRKWVTASAYDPVEKRLWVAGRGESGASPWSLWGSDGGILIALGGGTQWACRYEGDALPSAAVPTWTVAEGSEVWASVDSGVLRVNDTGIEWDDKVKWSRHWGASPATGTTVIARARCASHGADTTYTNNIFVDDGSRRESLKILTDRIVTGESGLTYMLDGTAWHVYRMTTQGTEFKVYVDEYPTPVLQGTMGATTSDNRVMFGSGSSLDTQDIYFDYVRYTSEGPLPPGEGGGGNWGFTQYTDPDEGDEWRLSDHTEQQATLACRFHVSAYSGDTSYFISLRCPGDGNGSPEAGIAVRGGRYKLAEGSGFSQLVDLGAVGPGVFHEAYITVDRTADTIVCWWDGGKVYDGPGTPTAGGGLAQFGGGTQHYAAADATATFDWVGFGPGAIGPGQSGWSCYLPGDYLPQASLTTNIMSRWNGNPSNPGLFDPATYLVASVDSSYTNGNNPIASGIDNRGHYWVSAMAVHPVSGRCWMGYTGEATYDYDTIGTVWSRGAALDLQDEGVPEADAYVVGLTFTSDGSKVYALVCNKNTGDYSVYWDDATFGPIASTCGGMKKRQAGANVETNEPKVVTWPEFSYEADHFYIQDAGHAAGIKVVPANPDDVKQKNDMVTVEGILGVVDGEATITQAVVTPAGSGTCNPIAMPIKSVGGEALPLQPATDPAYGPTNVCNLVRIAGLAKAYVTDDISGLSWLTIDDGSGAKTKYIDEFSVEVEVDGIKVDLDYPVAVGVEYLIVTGISSVEPDFGMQRVIRPRDPANDIEIMVP